MASVPTPVPGCAISTCSKTATELHACPSCKTTYCSRRCQRTDMKVHKRTCSKPPPPTIASSSQENTSTSPPEDGGINDLHSLTKTHVVFQVGMDGCVYLVLTDEATRYNMIIDAYRIRMHEEYGVYPGIYPGQYHPIPHFRQFLELAVHKRCLPGQWGEAKVRFCEELAAREEGGGPCILRPLVASELIERYGKVDYKPALMMAINKLRVLAVDVYGCVADRPKDASSLEGLPYVRVNGQWGLIRD